MQKRQRAVNWRLSNTEELPRDQRIENRIKGAGGALLATAGIVIAITNPLGLNTLGITLFELPTVALGIATTTKAAIKSGIVFRWRKERDLKLVAMLQASQDLTSSHYGPDLYLQDGLIKIAPTIIKQIKHPWFSKHFTRREQKIVKELHQLFNLAGTSPDHLGHPGFRSQLETGMEWAKSFLVALTNRLAPQSPSYKVPLDGYFVHWLDGSSGKSLIESLTQQNPQPEPYRDFIDTHFDNVNNGNRQILARYLAIADVRITRLEEQIDAADIVYPIRDEGPFEEAMNISNLHEMFALEIGGTSTPENGGHLRKIFRRDPTVVEPTHGSLTLPERPFGHR